MLNRIKTAMKTYVPGFLEFSFSQAGVLLLITRSAAPEIILTQRAQHLRTHKGQVAFPGGMKDEEDGDLLSTALRETQEEIGVPADEIEILGQLNQVISRYEILVSPFVGIVEPDINLVPEPQELDSIFKVPIDFFLDTTPNRIDQLGFNKYKVKVPSWQFENYEIWGLSAIILTNFLGVVFDRDVVGSID